MNNLYSHTRTDGDYAEKIKVINESDLTTKDHVRYNEVELDNGEFVDNMIDQIDVAMALEKLPPEIQPVIEMLMDGFDERSIAEKLETTRHEVRKRIQDAQKILHPTQWKIFNLQVA